MRTLLGGQVTISGLYEQVGRADLNVVIVTLASASADAPDNRHTLPHPFAAAEHKGSVLLFRNDEDAKPVDFTLADYATLQEAKAGEEQPAAAAAGAEEVDEDDEEESEEDEDEDELTEEQTAMLQAVIGNFTKMKGRPPTEIELVAIMNQLNQRIVEADSEDDSDVDEEEMAAENEAEAQDGDEDDEEDESDDEEDEEDESDDEEAPAAAPASAARGPRKGARQSVEGTPGLRRGKASGAPAPPAPIIRKNRRAAAAN